MSIDAGHCLQGIRPLVPAQDRHERKGKLLPEGRPGRHGAGGLLGGQGPGRARPGSGSAVDPGTLADLFSKRLHPAARDADGNRVVLGRKPHEFKKGDTLKDEIAARVEELYAAEPPEMQTPERKRDLTFMVRL